MPRIKIKRLYTFMLQTFLPLLLMTFGICLFIVLMQFLWKYVDDMVGKGLAMSVLAQMFTYAALALVPMALPLSILLASLMTFGNLGERFELLAMKSAGVSLINIMKPLIIVVIAIGAGAFFYQNYAMPKVQVKLYTLLFSMKQKSPELEIPEGVFYNQITGYNVYVKQKDRKTGLLKNVMIYDYSNGFNNASVIVADSGRLKMSADKMFLVLLLYNGESFANLKSQSSGEEGFKTAVPYERESFRTRELLIEFNANFTMTDESFLSNQYIGKNLSMLQTSIDSMKHDLDSIKVVNAKVAFDQSYKRTIASSQSSAMVASGAIAKAKQKIKIVPLDFDSIVNSKDKEAMKLLLERAQQSTESLRSDNFFKAASMEDEGKQMRRHITEWHKKFAVSFACIIFFFIGAPLGAIIRKGGLGVPVIISVFLFIFYYIIDTIGYKMARDGIWYAWQGMWLSSAVLAPLGIFLTYKAVNDSVIMNADTYINAIKNLLGRHSGRKIERKEVIMYFPDYQALLPRIKALASTCTTYINEHRRWLDYLSYWKQGGQDIKASKIAEEMESIIEELNNSDQNLVLNKLMDFPIISGYSLLSSKITPKTGYIIGLCFPLGIPVYLLATYQRKLLLQDIGSVKKTCEDLIEMIEKEKDL